MLQNLPSVISSFPKRRWRLLSAAAAAAAAQLVAGRTADADPAQPHISYVNYEWREHIVDENIYLYFQILWDNTSDYTTETMYEYWGIGSTTVYTTLETVPATQGYSGGVHDEWVDTGDYKGEWGFPARPFGSELGLQAFDGTNWSMQNWSGITVYD